MFVNNLVVQHELLEDGSFLEAVAKEHQNMALANQNVNVGGRTDRQ